MTALPNARLTVDEYLAWAAEQPGRYELRDGTVKEYTIEPEQFGLKRCQLSDLNGGSAQQSAGIVLGVLDGVKGPTRDVILLNSGAALYVAELWGQRVTKIT